MAWYQESFGNDYLLVYKHRDMQGAYHEVKKMMDWLDLEQGADVLDLCCGMGRHSLALADFGYEITGVDLSEVLLTEAAELDKQKRVTWVRGDMREVPLGRQFDAVVNLFTSFGYFDEEEQNAKVFYEMHRLLKEGGRFIIDFLNPIYVQTHLVPRSQRMEGDIQILETRAIEDGCVRKRIVISQEGFPERKYLEQVKLYDRVAFEAMLQKAGLHIDHVYGSYDGHPYEADSSCRMIFVGHKEG
ncbi:class I SAM-dependent methyltransferase [Paenibacillus chondroitinus]|uniref:Class I SAM-dependent methyltransferase n=1 Tax=Paenibacillus chondroitinus TaxID=59842 RepID=A0ABU6DDE4_9BACL|nr:MULTISPECIES: class I SAM-dependent methyltransferase [Paenibacillus]MCY9658951.1 methyltransferase domain-containing protein [Paenibacillus anseongense]MEB4794882.1 class I SAM-dependent methyltransferase [Paenibacillus chondroitinus]